MIIYLAFERKIINLFIKFKEMKKIDDVKPQIMRNSLPRSSNDNVFVIEKIADSVPNFI